MSQAASSLQPMNRTPRARRPAARRPTRTDRAEPERLQKVLARLGLGSRREVEGWIEAGRLRLNDRVAKLGDRIAPGDRLQLDGRPVRLAVQRGSRASAPVFLCNRSPGQVLIGRTPTDAETSLAAGLPRRAGRRYFSVSPMPLQDGGLELLTSDGDLATRLQRAVRRLEMEFRLRVRGEITAEQQAAILAGKLDHGLRLEITDLEAAGGEGANRWYRLLARGVSGSELRQLLEGAGIAAGRVLRVRLGTVLLDRTLARGHSRELRVDELAGLLQPVPATAVGSAAAAP
jgi:23S rRNA pseudouridine2605 synthase